jgi:hypothetical protein
MLRYSNKDEDERYGGSISSNTNIIQARMKKRLLSFLQHGFLTFQDHDNTPTHKRVALIGGLVASLVQMTNESAI